MFFQVSAMSASAVAADRAESAGSRVEVADTERVPAAVDASCVVVDLQAMLNGAGIPSRGCGDCLLFPDQRWHRLTFSTLLSYVPATRTRLYVTIGYAWFSSSWPEDRVREALASTYTTSFLLQSDTQLEHQHRSHELAT